MAEVGPDYDFQDDAIWQALMALDENDSAILQMPTGGGKTRVGIRIAQDLPKPVLWLAESREIIKQTRSAFQEQGIETDLLDANTVTSCHAYGRMTGGDITVASQRTAWSRAVRKEHFIGDFASVVTDEGHHARARTYEELYKKFPEAKRLLLTATPVRGDGRGLGSIAKVMVQSDDYRGNYSHLIDRGVLVPCPPESVWTWPVGMSGVKTTGGDYLMGGKDGAAVRMDLPKLIGDIVKHWQELAEGRRTIVYASSVSHAENIAECFNEAGVPAAWVGAKTPKTERDAILDGLAEGSIRVVANFGVLTEGFDCPSVSCIVLARPTKLLGLYLQMVGRGLRASPGKTDLRLLDHVGIVNMHGLPGTDIEWTLSTDTKAGKVKPKQKKLPRACPECDGGVMVGFECAQCGYKVEWQGKENGGWMDEFTPEGHDLDRNLERMDGERTKVESTSDQREVADFHRLRNKAKKNGLKDGWVSYKFKEKYGHWPPSDFWLPNPEKCTPREYLTACEGYASDRNWKPGWSAVQFKKVYGRWPGGDKGARK